MLEKYLQDIGLNEKEATIYTSLLQVDHVSVLDLSKKTKVNRSTVYVVLESLAKKGLVSEIQIDKKVHYQAEPPERLETFVERQKVLLDEQSKRLKDIIPQLKTVQRETGEKPVVKYFEGREGIISANEELFSGEATEAVTYLIYSKDLVDQIFPPQERQKYRNVRLNKNLKSKVIYSYKKGEITADGTGERIKIDGEKYPLTCDISIYGDKVRISILGKKLSGIFIQSQDFANTMKSLFKLAYDNNEKK
jgi:sugar-specific transcriptional regulator TrmB